MNRYSGDFDFRVRVGFLFVGDINRKSGILRNDSFLELQRRIFQFIVLSLDFKVKVNIQRLLEEVVQVRRMLVYRVLKIDGEELG